MLFREHGSVQIVNLVNTMSTSSFTKKMDSSFEQMTKLLARWQGQHIEMSETTLDLSSNMGTAIKNLSKYGNQITASN